MQTRFALLCALFFTACLGGGSDENDLLETIRSARSGARISAELSDITHAKEAVPAALAGTIMGVQLSDAQTTDRSIPESIPLGSTTDTVRADTDLLASFVVLMQTNMQNLLNQTTDREGKLDEYTQSLSSHVQRGSIRFRELEDRKKNFDDDTSRLQRRIRNLEDELDKALTKGDSQSAAVFTQELIERQTLLAKTKADILITKRILESYSDLLGPMEERLNAINANRNALIQGIRIVDIPGVEELGILEVGQDGIPRLTRKRKRGIF
jgi:hypothetical protein